MSEKRRVGEKAHMVLALKSSAHVKVVDLDNFVERVKEDANELSHVIAHLMEEANIR